MANGTKLQKAVHNDPTRLRALLAEQWESERFSAVEEKQRSGNNLLHDAAKQAPHNPESWNILLEYLPSANPRLAKLITTPGEMNNTVLHYLANNENPQLLLSALSLLPEAEQITALNFRNHFGETVFHCAHKHPATIKAILLRYPSESRCAACLEKNGNGDTVLHVAKDNSKAIEEIFSSLLETEYLQVAAAQGKDGNTIFHLLASNEKNVPSLGNILELLALKDHKDLLEIRNANNLTALELAAKSELWHMAWYILGSYPADEIFNEMTKMRIALDGKNILQQLVCMRYANKDKDLLKIDNAKRDLRWIVELAPKTRRLEAFEAVDKNGHNSLCLAVLNPIFFEYILSFYPEEQRFDAIEVVLRMDNKQVHPETLSQLKSVVLHKLNLLSEVSPGFSIFSFFTRDPQRISYNAAVKLQRDINAVTNNSELFAIYNQLTSHIREVREKSSITGDNKEGLVERFLDLLNSG